MARMRVPFAIGVLLLAAAPAAARPGVLADMVHYRMKPGDTLHALAQAHLLRTGDYARLQRLNAIRDPREIAIGQVLRVPKAWLRYEAVTARVIAVRGTASLEHGSRVQPLASGAKIAEGDVIATTANAFLSLGLPDGSTIALPSQSRLKVTRLRRFGLTGSVDRIFHVLNGRAQGAVEPLQNDDDAFQLLTPISVSAVRGTQLRVVYDADAGNAATEVLAGKVHVSALSGKGAQDVVGGSGIVVGAGGLSTARPLLPPPALVRPDAVQDQAQLSFTVQAMPGATRFRVQVAKDAGFLDILSETVSDARVTLPAVEDGIWFVRVSAIDDTGLEGPAQTYSFHRLRKNSDMLAARRGVDGADHYLFRWHASARQRARYRFQLYRADNWEKPLVDEAGLRKPSLTLLDLPAGRYRWRVIAPELADRGMTRKPDQLDTLAIRTDRR